MQGLVALPYKTYPELSENNTLDSSTNQINPEKTTPPISDDRQKKRHKNLTVHRTCDSVKDEKFSKHDVMLEKEHV